MALTCARDVAVGIGFRILTLLTGFPEPVLAFHPCSSNTLSEAMAKPAVIDVPPCAMAKPSFAIARGNFLLVRPGEP